MRQIVLKHKPPTSPADKVCEVFGEVRAAEIAGVTIDALRKWRRRRATGGGGGLIPSYYQARYLRVAAEEGRELKAHDFIAEPY